MSGTARTKTALTSAAVEQLTEQIEDLLQEDKDDSTVCREAYDFSRSEAGFLLQSEEIRNSTTWMHLRHNIGRLASWYKAVKYLVNAAPSFPDALVDFVVEFVPQGYAWSKQVPFQHNLSDLFPRTETQGYDFSLDRMRTVFGVSAMEEVEINLNALRDGPRLLKLHAEVRVADFFHVSGRSYFRDVRYIGCSKGTCYCCDLYLAVHPGNLVRRPCHGNAWVKWQLSALMLTRIAETRPLERMVMRMRDDVSRAIMDEGQRGHAKTFDSSTGIMSFERVP